MFGFGSGGGVEVKIDVEPAFGQEPQHVGL